MNTMILLVVLIILFNAPAMAESPPEVPAMPPDFQSIQISKPDPAVPAELNLLLGEWEGVWIVQPPGGRTPMQVRRAKLIVFEVTLTKVKYLWGVGVDPETKTEAKWSKYESDLKERGGKKMFGHEGRSSYTGETRPSEFFLKDGVIEGVAGMASIEMKRVK